VPDQLKWRLLKKPYILGYEFVLQIALKNKWVPVEWSHAAPSIEMVQLSLIPAVEALRLATGRDYTPVQYCQHDGKWVPCQEEA